MTGSTPIEVQAGQWGSEMARLAAEGFDVFDFLTAVDQGSTLLVVARVKRSDGGAAAIRTAVVPADDPSLPSASTAYPGVVWHERETREMFGIEFTDLADDRPLLLRTPSDMPPMRRRQVLHERLERPWPGAAEPGISTDGRRSGNPSRRRQLPLGVPQDGASRGARTHETGQGES